MVNSQPSSAICLAMVRLRRALLVELVHVDLEFRLKAAQPARVETYFNEYPQLFQDRDTALELIVAEYELRRRQRVDSVEEYGVRFPGFAQEPA